MSLSSVPKAGQRMIEVHLTRGLVKGDLRFCLMPERSPITSDIELRRISPFFPLGLLYQTRLMSHREPAGRHSSIRCQNSVIPKL